MSEETVVAELHHEQIDIGFYLLLNVCTYCKYFLGTFYSPEYFMMTQGRHDKKLVLRICTCISISRLNLIIIYTFIRLFLWVRGALRHFDEYGDQENLPPAAFSRAVHN